MSTEKYYVFCPGKKMQIFLHSIQVLEFYEDMRKQWKNDVAALDKEFVVIQGHENKVKPITEVVGWWLDKKDET
jgi:hypothetical protein